MADPAKNLERVAGTGDRCLPGDDTACGDGRLAVDAKLSHPKGRGYQTVTQHCHILKAGGGGPTVTPNCHTGRETPNSHILKVGDVKLSHNTVTNGGRRHIVTSERHTTLSHREGDVTLSHPKGIQLSHPRRWKTPDGRRVTACWASAAPLAPDVLGYT